MGRMARASRARIGSIREVRPGTWEVSKQVDGRRRYATVRGTYEDAVRAALDMADRMGSTPAEADGMSVGMFYREYFIPGLVAQGRARATVMGYESTWRNHVEGRWSKVPLEGVRECDVASWGWTLPTPNLALKSVKLLKQVMRSAYDYGLLADPPLQRRIPLPRVVRERPTVWDAGEVAEAARRLRGDRLEVVFLLMAGHGLRCEEALAATPSDVWYERQPDGSLLSFVRVDKAMTSADGLRPTKNPQSVRTAVGGEPFSSRMAAIWREGPSVPTRRGTPMYPDEVSRRWHGLFDEGGALEGMKRIKLMNLRHTHENLMLYAEVSGTMVAKAHGHSQAVSYGSYLNPPPRALKAAALEVARVMRDYSPYASDPDRTAPDSPS